MSTLRVELFHVDDAGNAETITLDVSVAPAA